MSPLLAWGDFHARSRFARSTIPEEKWGTTRSLPTYCPTLSYPTGLPFFRFQCPSAHLVIPSFAIYCHEKCASQGAKRRENHINLHTSCFFLSRDSDCESEEVVQQNSRCTEIFDIRFSYNHCNFSRVCLLVKMASKTVTRSFLRTLKHPK